MTDHPLRPRSGPAPRLVLVVATVAIASVVAFQGWRWRADRAYVGTEVATTFSWTACLNGAPWVDLATGIVWTAADDPVIAQPIDSDPPRLHLDGGEAGRAGVRHRVEHRSTGTMRFDSRTEATFTNQAGGALRFERHDAGDPRKLPCLTGAIGAEAGPAEARQLPSATGTWGTVSGFRGVRQRDGAVLLEDGDVTIIGADQQDTARTETGGFRFWVPPGTWTVTSPGPAGECRSDPVTVAATGAVVVYLICEPA